MLFVAKGNTQLCMHKKKKESKKYKPRCQNEKENPGEPSCKSRNVSTFFFMVHVCSINPYSTQVSEI